MRVLYIAHYRENSGWGEAARNYILALDSIGVDVVCRPIIFRNNATLSDKIKELESKPGGKFDFCIQNVLPHFFEVNRSFKKNVGQFFEDTYDIKYTSWFNKINMMDMIFTSAELKTQYKPKWLKIPVPVDTSIYNKEYPKLNIANLKDRYVFYYIGEFNRRKNIGGILRAFHTAFSKADNVALILKLSKPGTSPEDLGSEINELATSIKTHLGKFKDVDKYQREIVIPFNLTREDILRLHSTGDCFITTSYGEGWNIPAFEAVAMKNELIAPKTSPYTDYAINKCLFDVNNQQIIKGDEIFNGFGSCRESWDVPDISSVVKWMQRARLNKYSHISTLDNFSYEIIGEKIMKALLL